MRKSILDYNIYNSVNPDAIEPKVSKPKPFPLENIEEEMAAVYKQVDGILMKLIAAKKNPIVDSPAKQKLLSSMKYKAELCKKMIKQLSVDSMDIFY